MFGNCGQMSLALIKFIMEHGETFNEVDIFVFTDIDSGDYDDLFSEGGTIEELLINADYYLWHCVVQIDGKFYDGRGEISSDQAYEFVETECGDDNPHVYALDATTRFEYARRIISFNTSWDTEWVEYYSSIMKFMAG